MVVCDTCATPLKQPTKRYTLRIGATAELYDLCAAHYIEKLEEVQRARGDNDPTLREWVEEERRRVARESQEPG